MSTLKHRVNEFQFLDNLKSKYSLDRIGDDCAVLPKDANTDLLLTADMLVEDIDFHLKWTKPEFLGHKALAVSLSDIAAMGGQPKWAMLSLGIPEKLWNTNFVDDFYAGWFALANEFDVELVGGDVSRVPDKLVIDSIVGGEVAKGKAVLRSGAKPGDVIYVTGSVGGAAGGLRLLELGDEKQLSGQISTGHLTIKQTKPTPQLTIANLLQQLDITTSMIDLSDGLSSDLFHICQQSGVGATIYTERLPINAGLPDHFGTAESHEMALHGGEDFELLFTVGQNNISALESINVTCIGEITATGGVIELNRDGKLSILEPKGYSHF
ncbi:MAG: thiamine-phosphate kinase [Chloracidobacterium sp.]|nr:thiamine-phosphate kinase [Chloracidobacterium sp.]